MHVRWMVGRFAPLVAAFLFCGAASAPHVSATGGPPGLAFYAPPSPIPPGAHGDVIWARPLTGSAVLKDAAANTLVLYHENAIDGTDVAVSGTIAVPQGTPPAGGWPVISWAHGTTGNAPQCAPSRLDGGDFEQTYLDAWITRGFAVVQTDYEGQGTPGIHPYFVGVAAGRDTTDIVRAARQLYPTIGKKWFAFGHSEGGSASIFTAGVGPEWAPELTLEGAVSFAPGSHIGAMLHAMPTMTDPTPTLAFMLAMIEGIASVDSAIDVKSLLTPEAYARLPDLQKRCTDELMNDDKWTSLPPSQVFRPGADTKPLLLDFLRNESNRVHADVPLLVVQGSADDVVDAQATGLVVKELCKNGTKVTYDLMKGKTHDSIVSESLSQTEAWVDAVAAGSPPKPSCT